MDKKFIVDALNILINEAVKHGADTGGSYNQNEEGLVRAVNTILNALLLSDNYNIITNIDQVGNQWSDVIIAPKSDVYVLNPIYRNELEKAIIGRVNDYDLTQQIIHDFNHRVAHIDQLYTLYKLQKNVGTDTPS